MSARPKNATPNHQHTMETAKIFIDENNWTIIKHSGGEVQILDTPDGHFTAFVPVRHSEGVDDGVNGRPLTGIPHQRIESCIQEVRNAYPSLQVPYATTK